MEPSGLSASSLVDQLFTPTAAADAGVRALETVKPPAAASQKDKPGELHFAYRPMWDTTLGALSAYLCVPLSRSADASAALNDVTTSGGGTAEALVQHDFDMQAHVCGILRRMQSEGCRVLIVLGVHFETLAAAARRRRYVETLAQSISAELARLLVIEIVDVPDGVPPSRIFDIVSALRSHCRGVSARVRIENADLGAFAGAHVHAVGCDIGSNRASELVLMQQLSRFSRAAEKVGVASFVHGLRSISLTGAAVGAGYRYIDGEGVAKLVQRPERVTLFNLGDLYRPILDAAPDLNQDQPLKEDGNGASPGHR
jgi:hypothetical protein